MSMCDLAAPACYLRADDTPPPKRRVQFDDAPRRHLPMTRRARVRLLMFVWIIGLSMAAGAVFGFLITEASWIGLLRGATTGLLISTPVVAAELYYFNAPPGRWLRRQPIWRYLAIKCGVYAVGVLAGETGAGLFVTALTGVDSGPSAASLLYTTLFSIVVGLTINFVMVIRLMLGDSALSSFFIGRYHRPREEERIFLFLDLVGSTAIAERIGHRRFLDLLNRFIFDVTPMIVESGGDIYRYVGDEVIATWPVGTPAANGRPIAAWGQIRRRMDELAPRYRKLFGIDLDARAALHAGHVVVGELGDWKREIALLGEVVNTTSRIEQACRDLSADALASVDMLSIADLPPGIEAESVGRIPLRGREAPLELHALRLAGRKTAPAETKVA